MKERGEGESEIRREGGESQKKEFLATRLEF